LFWSLCYLAFRCLLQFLSLRPRSQEFKEREIVVLRHELAVLRRETRRPQLTAPDRVFLAAASRNGVRPSDPIHRAHVAGSRLPLPARSSISH
jgi:hypothetical protein